ncbi:MAG: class I SAM-dependent methyltransferase [archaeon]
MIDREIWEKKHRESLGRYHKVTDFARLCFFNFIKGKNGRLLDLCCGKGADSIFFHNKGLTITAVDFSNEAIKQFNETQKRYDIFVSSLQKDISEQLPFEDEYFPFIYSRLGLHYFTDEETKKIFSEIKRVLKSEGLFMFQVKSTSDKDCGQGKELEKDMYKDETGHVRHFFSREYAEALLSDFNIVMLEERKIDNGSAYLEIIAEKK